MAAQQPEVDAGENHGMRPKEKRQGNES